MGITDKVAAIKSNPKSKASLKGKFSSGIEGALASTLHHDFNSKQLSEMMLSVVLLDVFKVYLCYIDSETTEK